MKKYYEPELNIVKFVSADVLASSAPTSKPNPVIIDGEGSWTPYV